MVKTTMIMRQAGEWLISLAAIIVYIGLTGIVVFAYLRRFGRFDRVTSYFMAMPGGLNEMTAIGHAMGGDDRAIALSHAWRMIIVVFTIPLSFRFFAGYIPPAVVFTGGFAQIGALDWSLLIACGILGTGLGRLLRLPAPFLTGSMALSGWPTPPCAASPSPRSPASRSPPSSSPMRRAGSPR